ncbi:MAG: PIN domain-containing protein [Chthoniobacterales bacterium]
MVRDFLDTSVLVAAFWGDHVNHESSLGIFTRASKSATACCAHSVAEVYSVMTSLPVRPAVSPDHALLFLEQLRERVAIVPLSEEDYFKTVRNAAELGLTGGRIYDVLLLAAAREVEAKHVYTWNIRHFQQIGPDLERRIRTPE